MQEQRARQILQALVQGIDPLTGAELAPDSVLQQVEVLRALLAGVAALESEATRRARRAQLPKNIGNAWDPEENERVVNAFTSGTVIAQIAAQHGRTERAIEARLELLGLIAARTDARHSAPRVNDRRAGA